MKVEFDANDFFDLFFKDLQIQAQIPFVEYEGKKNYVCSEDGDPFVFAEYRLVSFNGYDDYKIFKQDLESIKNRIWIEFENLILENPRFFNESYWTGIEQKFNDFRINYIFKMIDVDNVAGEYLSNAHFKNVGIIDFLDEVDNRYINTTLTNEKVISILRIELVRFTNPLLFLLDELKSYTKRILINSSELNRKIGVELKENKISDEFKDEFKEMVSKDETEQCLNEMLIILKKMPTIHNELIALKARLSGIRKENQQNLIDYECYQIQKSKITNAVLEIVDKI